MNITYKEASKVLNASIEKANELNIPVSIAVVDNGGHLMVFARLDSVYGVIDFAVKKAKTAVMFGVNSEIMGTIVGGSDIHGYGMLNSNGGLLTIPGGAVIKDVDGNIIGAVGSSGGTVEQDKEIAEAGANRLHNF
ncbi:MULTISPECIES: heme-binding protein [Flavobacterium]|uniref:Heme-binding protein n=1 Tax=Flavobacterium lipolyticum TaxID=2893754 RepID=A0ABS8M417_9FLAO|nr:MULTISPECIES: heme-binding protein [unclassified Flavobacterium]MCC9019527.1 heme-binding protein [Flavobacterium sp. F-126]